MGEPVWAPGGRSWVVKRRWAPRLGQETLWGRFHRRYRQITSKAGEAVTGALEAILEGLLVAIMLVVVALAAVFVVVPLLVIIVDLVIIAVMAVIGIGARVALGRPWIIEARSNDGRILRWHVSGWRASRRFMAETERLLASGVQPPADEDLTGS